MAQGSYWLCLLHSLDLYTDGLAGFFVDHLAFKFGFLLNELFFICSSSSHGIQRTPSNRSTTSTTSSFMSLETILDEDTTDVTAPSEDPNGCQDENRFASLFAKKLAKTFIKKTC